MPLKPAFPGLCIRFELANYRKTAEQDNPRTIPTASLPHYGTNKYFAML